MRRLPLILGGVVVLLGLAYGASFLLYGDSVPRGKRVRLSAIVPLSTSV